MSTSVVAGCLNVLLTVVSWIIHLWLSYGHFSEEWKAALVTPIFKKPGLDPTQLNKLRPVSNLHFKSKLTKRAVFDQIQSYESIRLLSNLTIRLPRGSQHRNSAPVGTEWYSHEYELQACNPSSSPRFERNNWHCWPQHPTLNWLTSYLNNRSQGVSLNGFTSDSFKLPHDVPQGLGLGTLLFTVYSSKLFEVIKYYLPAAYAYTDDTQLYLPFSPDSVTNQDGRCHETPYIGHSYVDAYG